MKKVFLLLTLTIFVCFNIFSSEVDPSTAYKVAKNFYSGYATVKKTINKNEISLSLVYTCKGGSLSGSLDSNTPLYYIFNINSNDGFVIVSAEDNVLPVIGYSNEGSYTGENLPPDLKWWMENYAKQIIYAIENNLQADETIKTKWNNLISGTKLQSNAKSSTVAPLIQTTWDQSPHVNALCPGGSVTGCVATAMAQIMKYWNFPPNGISSHSYNESTYGNLSVDFGATTYDWNAMPSADSGPCPSVATLMFSCGVSVDMTYSPTGSGAYVISSQSPVVNCAEYAFKTYFGYDPTTLQGLQYSNFTQTAFISMLKNELDNSRPLQYAGYDNSGGHTWVCDGYDINDFFHMNWGWGGSYNSYFDINVMNPGSYAFTNNQQVIIGIQPEAYAPIADFSANYSTSSCTGIVQFTDVSSHFPTSWRWDFGDGSTDTVRNPLHYYALSGTYTVKLFESNSHGQDSLVKTNYVSVNVTPAPVSIGVTICRSQSTTLNASGNGTINWFTSSSGGTLVNTGSVFVTPSLTNTVTYYIESALPSSAVYGGKPDNTGGGSYNTSSSNYLIFDCYSAVTLVSVDIYANSIGTRIIELRNSSGTVLQTANINITTTGLNTVTLNFSVPVGTNLQLGLSGTSVCDLYRNNAGVTFPYTTSGIISVTNSSAGNTRYYYFYNWQLTGSNCSSARTPVTVHVVQNSVSQFNFTPS